ncbi:MAG TPA: hypothetical protein EYP67_03075 [Methanosarcinales archaeon]|nr:hypothetical protein [Methanosarcinales archaeon]
MLFANLNLAMWAFFLSVIPLIIVYLLRPKAKDVRIPSIMFITQMTQQKKRYARVLSKLIKDPLFLIQLLVLLSLIVAIADPYDIEQREVSREHTVIILDGSASMQSGNKFVDAIRIAEQHLTAQNSIILAENLPVLALRGGDVEAAGNLLGSIPQTATTADLYQAITLGSTLLTDGGRIVVVSDFTNWDGEDPYIAKKLAEGDGIDVSFISVSDGENKIAVTGGWLSPADDRYQYTCIIKNYMSSDAAVAVDVLYSGKQSADTYDLKVGAHDSEYFSLKDVGVGTTEIMLHPADDLMVDNHAHIIVPFRQTQSVLYISDHGNSPSATVLKLLPSVDVVFQAPDEVRNLNVNNYDMAVVGLCNESPGAGLYENLADYAASGGGVVVMAQESLLLPGTDTGRLLPVVLSSKANETTLEEAQGLVMRGIDATDIAIGHHLTGDAKRGSVTWVASDEGAPIISYWRIGAGKVVYFGIPDIMGDDAWSDFHTKPEYPIFWLNLVDYLGGASSIEECNMQTGSTVRFDSNTRVLTPDGRSIKTDNLLLDQTGIYRLPDRAIAVNLYNAKESNLMDGSGVVSETPVAQKDVGTTKTDVKKEHDWILLALALMLISTELYYLRHRGEL